MLRTEQNSGAVRSAVARAFRRQFSRSGTPVFEHGQWWIIEQTGAQFSVVDASTASGFDFEQVTEADAEDDAGWG